MTILAMVVVVVMENRVLPLHARTHTTFEFNFGLYHHDASMDSCEYYSETWRCFMIMNNAQVHSKIDSNFSSSIRNWIKNSYLCAPCSKCTIFLCGIYVSIPRQVIYCWPSASFINKSIPFLSPIFVYLFYVCSMCVYFTLHSDIYVIYELAVCLLQITYTRVQHYAVPHRLRVSNTYEWVIITIHVNYLDTEYSIGNLGVFSIVLA